jgi:nucleotide-binding universal stress UspA family protein
MRDLKNILIPTDFSENSIQALEIAQCLANKHQSIIHLLHTIEPILASKQTMYNSLSERFVKIRIEEANSSFNSVIDKVFTGGLDIIKVIRIGEPSEEILKYAKDQKIDMIIIASHGRTGLTNRTTGGVADRLLKNSEIPIICVKSAGIIRQDINFKKRITFAENWVG